MHGFESMDLSLLHGNKYSKFPLLLIFFSCYDTIFVPYLFGGHPHHLFSVITSYFSYQWLSRLHLERPKKKSSCTCLIKLDLFQEVAYPKIFKSYVLLNGAPKKFWDSLSSTNRLFTSCWHLFAFSLVSYSISRAARYVTHPENIIFHIQV
jgi:hypothetical protein